MPTLQILTGPLKDQNVNIPGERFVLGRERDCELVLDIPLASRHHACLYKGDDGWRIQDMGSVNGTLHNGAKVQDAIIVSGDKISIGEVVMVFSDGKLPAAAAATMPAAPPAETAPVQDAAIQALVQQMSLRTKAIGREMAKVIIGQSEIVSQLLTAIISNGHVLMIGMPGLAKTTMIRTLSEVIDLKFNRIQFTPDLMPSDITGTEVLEINDATGHKEYRFIKGPIFCNILLADEINRTPPKTQAALLEAMQEHRVTAAGHTYQLTLPFFVLATQNPLEQEGTYPLPEAQLDRFMFSIYIDYPTEAEEEEIARVTTKKSKIELQKVLASKEILELQDVVRGMPVSNHVVKYATRLARSTRPVGEHAPDFIKKWIHCGAGPRASQYLVLAAKGHAVSEGRLLVTTDDVRAIARPILRHRMFTNFAADAEGMDTDKIVQRLIEEVSEPSEKDY
ncbi:MAG: AAA family ATPase [Verrucomicrobia bacterium]|nr:AAA family ATPase [Verrucomicrobiota bacterium]